ncbi:hypothetical protein Ocin01_09142 [Orchesella cincta]|uniref:Uncharacterized protein n=1 Tax=Orchesella cincta TaxID=48709 RepID=A0A1D2MWV1_ORCCI|nr:hypothetical protein Ocin01_09142 [Orchesella cincta]
MALQQHGITIPQLETWWAKTRLSRGPRVFPICITKISGKSYPPSLSVWGPILDDIALNDIRFYDKSIHSWEATNSTSAISDVDFTFVVQKSEKDEKNFLLYHWVNLHIRTRVKTQGLFIQAITGPLGLPGGEFDINVPCSLSSAHSEGQLVHPCTVAPKSSYTWPNIYAINIPSKSDHFSVRFRWDEAQCLYTGIIQFIMITTGSFRPDDYEIKLSRFYYTNYDVQKTVLTGMSTKPYLGFKGSYECDSDSRMKYSRDHPRIIPSMEFDKCLTKGVGLDSSSSTCPPGPFVCRTLWRTDRTWWNFRNDYGNILKKFKIYTDCCELGKIPFVPTTTTISTTTTSTTTPTTTSTTTPTTNATTARTTTKKIRLYHNLTSEEKVEVKLSDRAHEAEAASRVTHGDLCILVYLLFIPLANHIARFYKDFPDFKNIGLGFWIIAHTILHSVSLIMTWLSFGLVTGTGENKLGDVSASHFSLGSVVLFLQHMVICSSLKLLGVLTPSKAFPYVSMHSLGARFSYGFSILTIVFSNAVLIKKLLAIALVFLQLMASFCTAFVEYKQDKLLGITIHRAWCPVLQRVSSDFGERTPYMRVKTVLLVMVSGWLGSCSVSIYKTRVTKLVMCLILLKSQSECANVA